MPRPPPVPDRPDSPHYCHLIDQLPSIEAPAPVKVEACARDDDDDACADLLQLQGRLEWSPLHALVQGEGAGAGAGAGAVPPADDGFEFAPFEFKHEPLCEEYQQLSGSEASDGSPGGEGEGAGAAGEGGRKSWSSRDMERALEALRSHHMSLTKAAARFGIPSTTLWQRARRAGIGTRKRAAAARRWADADLRTALARLRDGTLSANKASKAYGIPSSTLYKIARREGIRLAAPFNAAPVPWRRADLRRALRDIRAGAAVQRAAAAYGIPSGTLYGRCKREGIELSRASPAPWSEGAMADALDAVRVGQMSINQAAIHYNLPYSSLYGRFKRCKLPAPEPPAPAPDGCHPAAVPGFPPCAYYPAPPAPPQFPPHCGPAGGDWHAPAALTS